MSGLYSRPLLSVRSSAASDFLSVATATPSKIQLADKRISCGISPDIIQIKHELFLLLMQHINAGEAGSLSCIDKNKPGGRNAPRYRDR